MSEDVVMWLRRVCGNERWDHPLTIEVACDLLSEIDDRDAEIERLRENIALRDRVSAEREEEMLALEQLMKPAPPTLAEVAKELYVRWVTDATAQLNWSECATYAREAAEVLLAELERRGAKCK